MPTIYLSHWGGFRTPGAHGPGRRWTIMALPRRWEKGEGYAPLFVPDAADVQGVQEGTVTVEEYRARYLRLVASRVRAGGKAYGLFPGHLTAITPLDPVPVEHGDTLLCACSVSKAFSNQCHRTWAGAVLRVGGWDVVLDTNPMDEEWARRILRIPLTRA